MSHSSKDRDHVEALGKHLVRGGIYCFIDEAELGPGDSLRQRLLVEGIPDSTAVFVLLSDDSINSNWVKKEIDVAMTLNLGGKPLLIIPYVLCKGPDDFERLFGQLSPDLRSVKVGKLETHNILDSVPQLLGAVYRAAAEKLINDANALNRNERERLQLEIANLEKRIMLIENDSDVTVAFGFLEGEEILPHTSVHSCGFFKLVKKEATASTGSLYGFKPLVPVVDIEPSPKEVREHLNKRSRSYLWHPVIRNEGLRAITDIVLDISLPKSIECIEGELAFPQGLGLAGMNISRSLEPIKLDYIRDIKGETVIRYRIDKLLPGVLEFLPSITVIFPCTEERGKSEYALGYSLSHRYGTTDGELAISFEWDRSSVMSLDYQHAKYLFDK